MLSGSGSFLPKAHMAHGTEMMGMIGTTPIGESSGEKPYTEGPEEGSRGPRGPRERFRPVPHFPVQGPTPGPLI